MLSAERLKQLQLQAEAEIQARMRAGTWGQSLKSFDEYRHRPIDFAVDKLGITRHSLVWSENDGYEDHEWDGTPDPIVAIANGLAAGKDVGVESGTGTGKSHALGWLQLWFLASWVGARTFSFASKEEQLDIYSWTEIKRMWPKFQALFPLAELTNLRIRMAGRGEEGEEAGWGAIGRSAGVGAEEEIASKAAGMHAAHMMILVEEAQGVPLPVSKAIENTVTGVHNLRCYVGNPDHEFDTLHQFCISPGVEHVRISALDHPNVVVNNVRDPDWQDLANDIDVVPGAVSRRSIADRTQKYGKGSRLYISRIRGISPPQAADALIRWEWCEAAAKLWDPSTEIGQEMRQGSLALGIDVADQPDGDFSAFARFQGACLTEVESFRAEDASKVGQRAYWEIKDPTNPIDPRYVGIDSVGVGASAVNEMRRLGLKVRHIAGGNRAVPGLDEEEFWSETQADLEGALHPAGPKVIQAERFDNLRSQVWWRLREDLRLGRLALPHDEELWQDLVTPKFDTDNGKIRVEPKRKIKERIGRSPDKGDAAAYGNFVRQRRPPKREIAPPHETENRDRGLERMLQRLDKERRREERQLQKMLRARAKHREQRESFGSRYYG